MDLSLKYAVAHMYSIPNPPFIKDAFPLLSPKYKTWLTIRNDDIYSMRWANVDYARTFINSIPHIDLVAGYYMGPDGYTWGRDYLNKNTLLQPPLVIKKQWVSNRIWGLLSFDPNLPKSYFVDMAGAKFAGENAKVLFESWENASMIFPYITRFLWGDIDLKWFPEANTSSARYRGFYTVAEYIQRQPMAGSNIAGIAEWLHSDAKSQGLNSPLLVADSLEILAENTFQGLKKLPNYTHTSSAELDQTLSDMEAFAEIGLYYAHKIRAAYVLGVYDLSTDQTKKTESLKHLQEAAKHWNQYANIYTQKNQIANYNRVGVIDVNAL